MKSKRIAGLAMVLVVSSLASVGYSQDSAVIPSNEEFRELLSKADEKVTAFENVIKEARPLLEVHNHGTATKYLEAADTAHYAIREQLKGKSDGYLLVATVTMLDDLALDAAKGSLLVMADSAAAREAGRPLDQRVPVVLTALVDAQSAIEDISELLLAPTLRLIDTEEKALNSSRRHP